MSGYTAGVELCVECTYPTDPAAPMALVKVGAKIMSLAFILIGNAMEEPLVNMTDEVIFPSSFLLHVSSMCQRELMRVF